MEQQPAAGAAEFIQRMIELEGLAGSDFDEDGSSECCSTSSSATAPSAGESSSPTDEDNDDDANLAAFPKRRVAALRIQTWLCKRHGSFVHARNQTSSFAAFKLEVDAAVNKLPVFAPDPSDAAAPAHDKTPTTALAEASTRSDFPLHGLEVRLIDLALAYRPPPLCHKYSTQNNESFIAW